MRKVDAGTHIFLRSYWEQMQARAVHRPDVERCMKAISAPSDLDDRFRIMDLFEDYEQVLSLGVLPLEHIFTPEVAIDMARLANDGLAELTDAHPDRFPGFFASLPMASPDEAIAETYRAVKDLGALGVQIFTHVAGRALDHADYLPIFRACYEMDVPLIMHPVRHAARTETVQDEQAHDDTWKALGRPYETSVVQTRLVYAGVLDTLPGIKIITHYMGGMVPLISGRTGPGWQSLGLRPTGLDGDQAAFPTITLKKPYGEYYKDFYANTALCQMRETMESGLAYHPRDRVLFATDAPLDPTKRREHIRNTIRLVEELDIDDDWKQDIFWRNAAKIMNFDRREDSFTSLILA